MAAPKGNTFGKQFQKNNKVAEKWTEEDALALGAELLDWMKASKENVFFDEFLHTEKMLYVNLPGQLAKKYKSFRDLLILAKKFQENKLRQGGLKRKFSEGMSKFCLINNHRDQNYSEKTDVNLGGQKDNPVQIVDFSSCPQKQDG